MAFETKYKMSRERFDEIKAELEYLQTVREKEVSELIKEARSFGDLTENSEYDEAKTEQGKLYSKMAELKNIIENAEIVEKANSTDSVVFGSVVRVLDVNEDVEEDYRIVGSQESNPLEGRISDESPFGRGLMGRKIGESVEVDAPAGIMRLKILSISK